MQKQSLQRSSRNSVSSSSPQANMKVTKQASTDSHMTQKVFNKVTAGAGGGSGKRDSSKAKASADTKIAKSKFYEPMDIAAYYPAGFDWQTVSRDGRVRKAMTPIN